MSWKAEVNEIKTRQEFSKEMGGKKAVAKQHEQGRLTVRERIDCILDNGSFREIGSLAGKAEYDENYKLKHFRPSNAVIGVGKINHRKVIINADDWTIRGGSSEATISEKWIYAENYALEMRLPLIRLVESAGGSVKLLEQQRSTKIPGYATWPMASLLGFIPVVGLALGPCAGLGALKVGCSHFSVMVKGKSQVFAGGPPVVERGMGAKIDKEELGGADVHVKQSGVVGNAASSEEEAFDLAAKFLSFLPKSVFEVPPTMPTSDPVDRQEEDLISIIPRDGRKPYNSRKIIDLIMDKGSIFELSKLFGRSIVTCFARLGGKPVGVLCNDPMHYGGGMTVASAEKMESFIDLCDTFHIPVINFVDQPGTVVGIEAERMGTVKGSIRVVSAIEQSKVPWCAVVVRRLYGLAGSAYARLQGINYHVAWPSATWGSIPIQGGVEAAYKKELEGLKPEERELKLTELEQMYRHLESPFLTAERFKVPEIIDPRETRKVLCNWLDDAWDVLPQQLGPKGRTMRL